RPLHTASCSRVSLTPNPRYKLLSSTAISIKWPSVEGAIHGSCFTRGLSMDAVVKAIWFVETHFSGDISLDDIAQSAGVSRYYMVRAFGLATGRSVMRHVRGRRLTEAARSLANGAPDILTVALDAGYGSHEAFTRAFREQFGLTPEA